MAWTDAARQAALEVRRAHAKAKGGWKDRGAYPSGSAGPIFKEVSSKYRKMLARNIRKLRNYKYDPGPAGGHEPDYFRTQARLYAQMATRSTATRNQWMGGSLGMRRREQRIMGLPPAGSAFSGPSKFKGISGAAGFHRRG